MLDPPPLSGDETFIIAAVMSMRHNKLTVLGGALSALYFMTVLSSALGLVLPNLISEKTVRSCATVLYTFFGLRLMCTTNRHVALTEIRAVNATWRSSA